MPCRTPAWCCEPETLGICYLSAQRLKLVHIRRSHAQQRRQVDLQLSVVFSLPRQTSHRSVRSVLLRFSRSANSVVLGTESVCADHPCTDAGARALVTGERVYAVKVEINDSQTPEGIPFRAISPKLIEKLILSCSSLLGLGWHHHLPSRKLRDFTTMSICVLSRDSSSGHTWLTCEPTA